MVNAYHRILLQDKEKKLGWCTLPKWIVSSKCLFEKKKKKFLVLCLQLASICYYFFRKVKVKLLSRVRLYDPMDCNLSGSSVHGIFQARVLEWVAISFSRGFSRPSDWTRVSHIVGRGFYRLSHQGRANWYTKKSGGGVLGTRELDFPDGPVTKTPCFQCKGSRFNLWSRN